MRTHSIIPTWVRILAVFGALFLSTSVVAEAPAATGSAAPPLSPEELQQLVAPIALYPDDLVAIILPSATNPLQLVQAERFLEKRKTDPKVPVDESWDDAVKALLNYPEVVKKMSDDLDWTVALGEAVVADQGQVLEAVQVFRRQVQSAGNLKSDGKQVVVVEKEVIKIVPADPQVIYVPQYNPTTVVYAGYYPSWGYYPAPYPVYYYPYSPGATFAAGLIWGAAITAAWNGGHYHSHWGGGGNNNINIDRTTNINVNRNTINTGGQPGSGQSSQWKPNKQPGQVSRTVGKTPNTGRVGDAGRAGAAGGARPSAQPAGGFGGGSAARPSTQPAGGFGGASGGRASTQPAGGASREGGGAFGGYDSGRQTRMDSSRGASSRSSMSGGSSFQRPSGGSRPSGGASRGGGGGRRR
jgi:hypothetical protein